jgi:hypothetical protein
MGTSQACRARPLALLVLLGSAFRASEALVRRNATVYKMSCDRVISFSGPMSGALKSEVIVSVQKSTGECPAGRYCPPGVSEPQMCPAGYYSSRKGMTTPCQFKCFPNYYCPDSGQLLPCPANTGSVAGASSQLDCKCDTGYQCTYRRSVRVSVALRVPYTNWTGPGGAGLRTAVSQAVAESAGVAVGSVSIREVLPGVVGIQGGNRRLLGESGSGGSMLSVSVEGARGLEGLRGRLERRRELGGEARVIWRRDERVYVVPEPAGWWEKWQLFKRRVQGELTGE